MNRVEWLRCSRVQIVNGRSPTAGRPTASNVALCCIGSVGTASGGGRNKVLLGVTILGLVRLGRNHGVLWTGLGGNATGSGLSLCRAKEVVEGW